MNYRYNTAMLPETHFLRVCLSCWKRLPTSLARNIQHRKFPTNSTLLCSDGCGKQWQTTRAFSTSHLHGQKDQEKFDIKQNSYFDKYKDKIQQFAEASPEDFNAKVSEVQNKKEEERQKKLEERREPAPPPKIKGEGTPIQWPPRSLDEIMKTELIQDKTAEEIDKIWKEYHLSKDCLFGVIKELDYDAMIEKSRICPTFLFPIPRNDGFEFILSQFYGKDVYFTPLGMFQLLKENSPPCLTVAHFPEFKAEKGIVLMSGQYDDKILTKVEALNLLKQLTIYYGTVAGEKFNLVRMFNHTPEKFKHIDLIEEYKGMRTFLEDNQLV